MAITYLSNTEQICILGVKMCPINLRTSALNTTKGDIL